MNRKSENVIISPNLSSSLFIYNPDNCCLLGDLFFLLKKELGCTYMFFLSHDCSTNEKVHFSTDMDFQKLWVGENLIKYCPIYSLAYRALMKKSIIPIVWDYVNFNSSEAIDLQDTRNPFNICHGFGVAFKCGSTVKSIGFAGDYKDVGFHIKVSRLNFMQSVLVVVEDILDYMKNKYDNAEAEGHSLLSFPSTRVLISSGI